MKRCLIFLVVALSFAGCTKDSTAPTPDSDPFSVVTWNIYLGADLTPVLTASSPIEVPARAAEVWARIQATDFPTRATQIAAEIAAVRPHVIGLQEVSLYRFQSPGDAAFGGQTPATDVERDHLQILLAALDHAGVSYNVASTVANFDVEVPMGAQLDDIRLTDRDVILVRQDIAVQESAEYNFAAQVPLPLPGGATLPFKRGWNSVVVNWQNRELRLINTHLETQSFPTVQQAQAQELLGALQNDSRPTLILGDFNSDASGQQTPTYDTFVAAGNRDIWEQAGGATCCRDAELEDASQSLSQRIDFIFATGEPSPTVVETRLLGTQMQGLWPSDHAGVSATLRYE